MIIGVPKELKNNENRIAMTPWGAKAYLEKGHEVIIQSKAGQGSGFSDDEYKQAGCKIYNNIKELYHDSDMIVKVKEPLKQEYSLFKGGQILFAYLHLAATRELTEALLKARIKAIAYETVELENGSLPLLTPMSEICGRMSVQIGANLLEKPNGGSGILLGGVPGVPPAEVVIVGGGNVGINAAKMALGMGARVSVLDVKAERLAYLDDIFSGHVTTIASNKHNLETYVQKADLLIGAILIPGKTTPKIIEEHMVRQMKKGAVLVDVSVDQGGCIDIKPEAEDKTINIKYGLVHYCVPNIPGAVPRTSTIALETATLPYGLLLADRGLESAVKDNKALRNGLNIYRGNVVYEGIAESLDLPYVDYDLLV